MRLLFFLKITEIPYRLKTMSAFLLPDPHVVLNLRCMADGLILGKAEMNQFIQNLQKRSFKDCEKNLGKTELHVRWSKPSVALIITKSTLLKQQEIVMSLSFA